MALIQCKECKAQISDSATSCPACGAPAPKKTSIFVKVLLGLFVVGVLISAFEKKEPEKQAPIAAAQVQAPVKQPLDCVKNEAEILIFANTHIKDHPATALNALQPCAKQTNGAAYLALIPEAEKNIKANKEKEIQQLLAMEKLVKENERADAKRKKSEGVTIGMTMDDVIASSWGKPQSVNRTTTANSVSEQWVYGGRNYLYFRDGILTSMQN